MTLRQNGDDEGALSFDPADKKEAALAIKRFENVKRQEATGSPWDSGR
jgi:hypothetical protein